jgi:hypothetical protein
MLCFTADELPRGLIFKKRVEGDIRGLKPPAPSVSILEVQTPCYLLY